MIDLIGEAIAAKIVAQIQPSLSASLSSIERQQYVPPVSDGRPRLLRIAQVKDRVGMSQTTIYDRIKKGTFPRPVPLDTLVAWLESEIDEWIAARVADRSDA
ncbi:helix-turn-helix transcriptional regulator [Xanthomonas arboricola]|uniref:helix-turn-helix transcriptional regulator n=1 Tax=Xanthomonas arboricola TaxID=56448 RepID=UPI00193100F9|nr:AlpA family transcriptional regulator [Xanthomonas arboricola]